MVGNDLVDLADPETLSPHPRFDERVFNPAERAAIAAACDPHRARWARWAAKESAFKLARRADPRMVFAHARFATELDPGGVGRVTLGVWTCAVVVSCVASAVHAVATRCARDQARLVAGWTRSATDADPRAEVRALTIASVARHLGCETSQVAVVTRPDRVPELVVAGELAGALSLSHHGAFVAFAWVPPRAA